MDNNDVEYDESLTQFLGEAGFTYKRLVPLLPVESSWANAVLPNEKVEDVVAHMERRLQTDYGGGCIFTLPGDGSDWETYVFGTSLSSHEIRKRVALKAFL